MTKSANHSLPGKLILILMRHAQAQSPGRLDDHERPLTSFGQQQAQAGGRWLIEAGVPDGILVSTAVRTQTTVAIMQEQWKRAIPVVSEPSIYEASPTVILDAIRTTSNKYQSLLVCGHNPGIQLLTHDLAGHASWELIEELQQGFTPGTIARLEFEKEAWASICHKSGRLTHIVRFQ